MPITLLRIRLTYVWLGVSRARAIQVTLPRVRLFTYRAGNQDAVLVDGRNVRSLSIGRGASDGVAHPGPTGVVTVSLELKLGPWSHQDDVFRQRWLLQGKRIKNLNFELVLELPVTVELELSGGLDGGCDADAKLHDDSSGLLGDEPVSATGYFSICVVQNGINRDKHG